MPEKFTDYVVKQRCRWSILSSLANVGAGGISSLVLQAERTALVGLEYENLAVVSRQSWRTIFATRSFAGGVADDKVVYSVHVHVGVQNRSGIQARNK